ncbi:MAG TPA: diaminopimelate decarboxylase, partial [Candidatus Acetothermia bacterium]|nr:diaminopimelate decarboxylase [Candidatus Acetothermia bacterium]
DAYRRARENRSIEAVGVHMHIGSQITDLSSYSKALEILHDLARTISDEGTTISYLDLGGGLGISYSGEPVPGPGELSAAVLPLLEGFKGKIILEPGRSIVGDAGVLLTTALYSKPSSPRSFLIVDAGMNDFIRPALYGAQHRVLPVIDREGPEKIVDVVGPVCESSDILAHHCALPKIEAGEFLAVRDVGAYGFSMSSRYNSRPRLAEVLVRGEDVFLIRERENLEDLTLRERIPKFLS